MISTWSHLGVKDDFGTSPASMHPGWPPGGSVPRVQDKEHPATILILILVATDVVLFGLILTVAVAFIILRRRKLQKYPPVSLSLLKPSSSFSLCSVQPDKQQGLPMCHSHCCHCKGETVSLCGSFETAAHQAYMADESFTAESKRTFFRQSSTRKSILGFLRKSTSMGYFGLRGHSYCLVEKGSGSDSVIHCL